MGRYVNVCMYHIIMKLDKPSFSSFWKAYYRPFLSKHIYVGRGGLLYIVKTERGDISTIIAKLFSMEVTSNLQ